MALKQRPLVLSTISLGSLFGYFSVVFLLGEHVLRVSIGLRLLSCILLVGLAAIYSLVWGLLKRQLVSESQLSSFAITSVITLLCFIASDISFTAYLAIPDNHGDFEQRKTDPNGWIGEWYPRLYYPTNKNFRLHKPNFTLTGDHYGNFYRPQLMLSPTLASSVFQKQHVSIEINDLGFRETNRLDQCSIFALGDSLTFGWGVTEGKTWTKGLEHAIGTCVYNLGIHDASPNQEVQLLEHLFEKAGERLNIQHVLWVIYEGNDLEDSYEDLRPSEEVGTLSRRFKGTVIENLYSLILAVKDESWINRLRTGQLRFARALKRHDTDNAYVVDGVRLANPLYYSPKHGYVLFYKPHLELASKPKSYVINHPHRRQLDQAFKRMVALSSKLHFKVTTVIAPTAIRLYASYFNDLNQITDEPYFINYIEDLSHENGFETVNLLKAMHPYARQELLYFRDDDHWNERGNYVVAQILKDHILQTKRNE